MKNLIVALALMLCFAGLTFAQEEDVKAKHDAYYRCINNIETDRPKAIGYCREYLKKYPNDDPRLTDFAGRFVTAYDKISLYTASIDRNNFTEKGENWTIYKPALGKTLPTGSETDGNFKYTITRTFPVGDEPLLNRAESVYGNFEGIEPRLYKDWRYFSQESIPLPEGEPFWWNGSSQGVLTMELVTTDAVIYYFNTIMRLRTSGANTKPPNAPLTAAELKYNASIEKKANFERSGKTFTNVYVANMTLTWGQSCGMRCGHGFTRNKLVVMSEKGEILEMFLDDKVNNMSWFS